MMTFVTYMVQVGFDDDPTEHMVDQVQENLFYFLTEEGKSVRIENDSSNYMTIED